MSPFPPPQVLSLAIDRYIEDAESGGGVEAGPLELLIKRAELPQMRGPWFTPTLPLVNPAVMIAALTGYRRKGPFGLKLPSTALSLLRDVVRFTSRLKAIKQRESEVVLAETIRASDSPWPHSGLFGDPLPAPAFPPEIFPVRDTEGLRRMLFLILEDPNAQIKLVLAVLQLMVEAAGIMPSLAAELVYWRPSAGTSSSSSSTAPAELSLEAVMVRVLERGAGLIKSGNEPPTPSESHQRRQVQLTQGLRLVAYAAKALYTFLAKATRQCLASLLMNLDGAWAVLVPCMRDRILSDREAPCDPMDASHLLFCLSTSVVRFALDIQVRAPFPLFLSFSLSLSFSVAVLSLCLPLSLPDSCPSDLSPCLQAFLIQTVTDDRTPLPDGARAKVEAALRLFDEAPDDSRAYRDAKLTLLTRWVAVEKTLLLW
jgi:hypothetical protein